jgi:hypothetical protein
VKGEGRNTNLALNLDLDLDLNQKTKIKITIKIKIKITLAKRGRDKGEKKFLLAEFAALLCVANVEGDTVFGDSATSTRNALFFKQDRDFFIG